MLHEYWWDPATGQYIDIVTGRFVARSTVRAALDAAILSQSSWTTTRLLALRAGTVPLDVWHAEMRVAVKRVNLWAAASAKGGWAQLTPADYGRVGRIIRDHYARLSDMVAVLASGGIIDGRTAVRTGLYTKSGVKAYHATELGVMRDAGYTRERNILSPPVEHCLECRDITDQGWAPIGTYARPGDRLCLGNCKCYMVFDFAAD